MSCRAPTGYGALEVGHVTFNFGQYMNKKYPTQFRTTFSFFRTLFRRKYALSCFFIKINLYGQFRDFM